MTIEKPLWLGPLPGDVLGPQYSAQADRQILSTLFTEGIGNVQAGELLVTPRAAGANMTVEVAPGVVYVTGDDVVRQGLYRTLVTATESVTIGAAPASNSRIDLVVARVWDAQAVGGTKHGLYLEVVAGTAAASPVAPAVPNSAVPLAQVLVAAGATSIQAGAITDRRFQAGAQTLKVGTQPQLMTQTQRNALSGAELYDGRFILNTTTGRSELYFAGAWTPLGAVQVDVFTASGTWTKPAGAKHVDVICFGAGGGGTTNTASRSGGGGGGYSRTLILASQLPTSVPVTVGAGGPGTPSNLAGNHASAGGDSTFGTWAGATGGLGLENGGTGGAAIGARPTSGNANAVDPNPTRGGSGTNAYGDAAGAVAFYSAPFGGGAGGTGGNSAFPGGSSGALAGGSPGSPGQSRSGSGLAGSGGGGSNSGSGNGGNGGIPGGGGGAGWSPGPGSGGSGARGEVIAITTF